MTGVASVGFFGKLPGMGDFVQRRLPAAFVSVWDARFEAAVGAARAGFGETWHAVWAAGPVWRFALMPGVCGVTAWVGVTGPSVDRVGRCFPMVLACPLTTADVFRRIVREGAGWFDGLERTCRGANATPTAESFDAVVVQVPAPAAWLDAGATALRSAPVDWAQANVWRVPWRPGGDDGQLAAWLLSCMGVEDGCLWWTAGAPRVPAHAILTRGLPRPADYAAFLDAARAPADWRSCSLPASPPVALPSVPPAPTATASGSLPGDLDDVLADLLPVASTVSQTAAAAPANPLLDDLDAGVAPAAAAPAPSLDDLVAVPAVGVARAPAAPARGQTAAGGGAVSNAPTSPGVISRRVGAVTVLAADNGARDPRRQAAARMAAAIDALEPRAGMRQWRDCLLALHPPLRERSEDLIDPVPEDGVAIVAHVAAGEAALFRVGTASAWHWRRGQLRSLFNDAAPSVRPDEADTARPGDLTAVLSSVRRLPTPGLGADQQPHCEEVSCLIASGDRLLLLATDTLMRVPAPLLATALAAGTGEEARARIAAAAGLGKDRQQWPVAVIEVGI